MIMTVSNAFIYRMPAGIAGDVTRREHAVIEPQQFDEDYPCEAFGIPVKMVSGKIRPMAEDDSSQPYGFLIRPYPSQMTASEGLGEATPDPTKIADVLVKGYLTVQVLEGTPTKDGAVYYRSQDGSPAENVGRLEVDSAGSPTTNVKIVNCRFMGTGDSNGNVEIEFNVHNNFS
jgi:hypothetical protein